jgi:hypothetical protein
MPEDKSVVQDNTITLSTGKVITKRQKKGQHHFMERALLAACMTEGGQNIGGVMSTMTIQNIFSIGAINGQEIKPPKNLSDVYEIMSEFEYDEWAEFEKLVLPKEIQEKLDAAAKNSPNSPGSETESK